MTTTTVAQLRAALDALDRVYDDKPVKAWLPGSTIRFEGAAFWNDRHRAVLLPANVDPGSALLDDADSHSGQISADMLAALKQARLRMHGVALRYNNMHDLESAKVARAWTDDLMAIIAKAEGRP